MSIWKVNEGDKFYRKCSVTGNGMNEGWVINCGELYLSTLELADNYAREHGYADFHDLYQQTDGDCYYTEWEQSEDEDDYEYVVNGKILIEIED